MVFCFLRRIVGFTVERVVRFCEAPGFPNFLLGVLLFYLKRFDVWMCKRWKK